MLAYFNSRPRNEQGCLVKEALCSFDQRELSAESRLLKIMERAWFSFVIILFVLRHVVKSDEFIPAFDVEKADIKPNSRNMLQQSDFGYNDVVSNDDSINDDKTPSFRTQDIDKEDESLRDRTLLKSGMQVSTNNNGGADASRFADQSVKLIDVLKSNRNNQPIKLDDVSQVGPSGIHQVVKLQNVNSGRFRSSSGRGLQKARPINPSEDAKNRCPECKEVLESIHKDMQGLNEEMDVIAQLIGAVLVQRNCSINELLPEHHWKLDGKCKDDMDTDNHVCALSCPSLFFHPETKKTPVGRAMDQLRLEPTRHHGICATVVNGPSGSFVDLGDWAGSCISQPERCSSGVSVAAWLKLNVNRESNVAYILTSGDFDARSRGFVILARYQEELGRNNIGLTVWLRDATHFWSAMATALTSKWFYFAFSWSRSGDLDIFIDGRQVTRNAIVTQDHSLPSPMMRLTIGNPPSIDKFAGSFAISALRVYLVRLEERDVLELYRRES